MTGFDEVAPTYTYIYIIFIILFVFALWAKRTRSDRLGKRGEYRIASLLERLDENEYIVMNDLMIDTNYGTTQIDHVVLSIYGIFVIETKNYSGWIYGGERAEEWTKNVYGNKYKFRNPIKQNYGHIKTLADKLNISTSYFKPIVVFTRRAKLKGDFESSVIYSYELLDEIQYHNTIKFTKEQIEEFKEKLLSSLNYDKEKKQKHVEKIRNDIANTKSLIRAGICPKCGGRLIERKGKYGSFLGCSNYPKCKYTLNK